MPDRKLIRGGCHCGKVKLEFETALRAADLAPWACDCSFCLKHGASYISDRNGNLRIEASGLDTISEYRQGSESARFLVCRWCGVLVAAVFDADTGRYAAVNSRCIDGNMEFGTPQVVSPRLLAVEHRRRRWANLWIPDVKLTISSA